MSIIVKGMKMPENCHECEFVDILPTCPCNKMADDDFWNNVSLAVEGHKDCPLVEVPPHGRLVDESWLKKAMITTLEALKKNPKMDRQEMHLIAAFDTLGKMVDDAPTIIEAEE